MAALPPPRPCELAGLCRRYGIRRLSIFGSAIRGDLRPDSDVDILVDYAPGRHPGLVGMHELEQGLSELFGGRRIDIVNRKYLNRRIRDRVLAEAQVQFAEE